MNMAYQAEQSLKTQILHSLTMDQVFDLLGDTDSNVVMKTLGLLRNLLSNKPVRSYAPKIGPIFENGARFWYESTFLYVFSLTFSTLIT